MGILKKLGNIISRKDTKPVNTFMMEQQIKAKEMVINSQVPSITLEDNKNKVEWNDWILINLWANYMGNSFKFKTNLSLLNEFIVRAARASFIYGRVGIYIYNKIPYLCSIMSMDAFEAQISIITDDKVQFDIKNPANNWIKVDAKDVYSYQWDTLGFGAFIMLEPVLTVERFTQRALLNEISASPTRLIYSDTTMNNSRRALFDFLKIKSPVLQRVEDGAETFEYVETEPNVDDVIKIVEYTKNYYYEILGRRTNQESKKAQLLSTELENGEETFRILERDRKIHFKNMLKFIGVKVGIDILLENDEGELESIWY